MARRDEGQHANLSNIIKVSSGPTALLGFVTRELDKKNLDKDKRERYQSIFDFLIGRPIATAAPLVEKEKEDHDPFA